MSRFFGYRPTGAVKRAVESFKSKTLVRSAEGMLLGTAYVDVRDEGLAVAIAYGRAHHPTFRGPEPEYEIRYATRPSGSAGTKRLDTTAGRPVRRYRRALPPPLRTMSSIHRRKKGSDQRHCRVKNRLNRGSCTEGTSRVQDEASRI